MESCMSKEVRGRIVGQTLRLRLGDCVEVMKSLPESSVGAVVCDPPYGLEFMGKAWDKLDWTMQGSFAGGGSDRFKSSPPLPSYGGATSENRICRTCKGSERGNDRVGFKRCRCEDPKFPERKLSTNAIGLKIQDSHGLWLAQVYRVLRPGGSIKVFAATRTQHRLTAAIEAVGFVDIGVEAWVYGSGFPKSMNVSKAIDRQWGRLTSGSSLVTLKQELKALFDASGKSRKQIDDECGFRACNYLSYPEEGRRPDPWFHVLPTGDKWALMKTVLNVTVDASVEARLDQIFAEAKREVIGYRKAAPGLAFSSEGLSELPITVPATPEAQTWDGWGTALKPAWEPVIVARKPLPVDG